MSNPFSELVSIHMAELPDSLNVRLGRKHMERLYCGVMAFYRVLDGMVVGGATATLDASALRRRLIRQTPLAEWLRIAWRIIIQPACWYDVLHPRKTGGPTLTTIVVMKAMQRHGVGAALIRYVDHYFRDHGVTEYRSDTREDNFAAQAFYRRMGFTYEKTVGRNVVYVRRLT